MRTSADADAFAQEWIAAWNARDLDAIMSHYTDNVEFSSPYIVKRFGEPSGTLRGKDKLRHYFEQGLALNPKLHFALEQVLVGVRSVTLLYTRENGARTTEVLDLDADGKVVCGAAHYWPGVG